MIHANSFVKRQTPDSEFSYFDGTWDELLEMVNNDFWSFQRPGYRDGVVLVDVDPKGFMSAVRLLEEGDEIVGEFKPRQEGEEPRLSIRVRAPKVPAKHVFIVLYRSDVLAEGGENELAASEDNWEIISINASPFDDDMPIDPNTLMHNHFGSDGGTDTKMTDKEFVEQLHLSFMWWKNKAMARL